MCSTSISIVSEESFRSDLSDFPAQAVNDGVTTGLYRGGRQYASCRSGQLKSLSLDKLPLQTNVTSAFTPLDSLVTKSLLDMTKVQREEESNNIREETNNFFKTQEDELADQAELSATILGNYQTKLLTMLQLSQSHNSLLQLLQ